MHFHAVFVCHWTRMFKITSGHSGSKYWKTIKSYHAAPSTTIYSVYRHYHTNIIRVSYSEQLREHWTRLKQRDSTQTTTENVSHLDLRAYCILATDVQKTARWRHRMHSHPQVFCCQFHFSVGWSSMCAVLYCGVCVCVCRSDRQRPLSVAELERVQSGWTDQ